MRGGVRCTRHHAVRQPIVDHHGGVIGNVRHGFSRLLQAHPLGFAQLIELLCEFFPVGIIIRPRVHQSGAIQRNPQFRGPGGHFLRHAKNREVTCVFRQEDAGRGEDPIVVTLGEHNVGAMLFRHTQQPVFEHVCGHHDFGRGFLRRRHRRGERLVAHDDCRDRCPQVAGLNARQCGRQRFRRGL